MPTKKSLKNTLPTEAMNPFDPVSVEIVEDSLIPDDIAARIRDGDTQLMAKEEAAMAAQSVEIVAANDEYDPYMDDSYADPDATYPRIQTLRGEGAQKPCWFIPADQLDRAGWLDPAPVLDTYHFAGGNEGEGLIIYNPRILVAAKTGVLGFHRQNSIDLQKLYLCGNYNAIPEDQRDAYGIVQFFRLYLLDENSAPLAEMPFEYRVKGATRATFVNQWERNCDDITRFHCSSVGKPFAKRNGSYKALCIFRPILARQKVETTKANVLATKVIDRVRPTADDWMSYFLGRNQNSDWYASIMDAGKPLLPDVRTDQAMLSSSSEQHLLAAQ